ncbi:MAG: hypothetical protein ABI273_14225 [Lacunisphaera sp.]
MNTAEMTLLTLFIGICTIPGIIAGVLASKKISGHELIIVILHSIAFMAPLVYFFGWYLLFDRPHARQISDLSNITSAFGVMILYGGPAAMISGSSSLLFAFMSCKAFKLARGHSEVPIKPPQTTTGSSAPDRV